MSLKYFQKFSAKRKQMHMFTNEHIKGKLFVKALVALKQNIEIQKHKKAKILFAKEFYDVSCQRRTLILLHIATISQKVDRLNT